MSLKYKLLPVAGRLKGGAKYRAMLSAKGTVDMDEILEEASKKAHTEPSVLRHHFESVMNEMISGVLEDGRRRRFGDYFTLRLDIRGSFDTVESELEDGQKPTFNFELHDEFRKAAAKAKLENEVRERRVALVDISSTNLNGAKIKPNHILWGYDITMAGYGMRPVLPGDELTWSFVDAQGMEHSGTCGQPIDEWPNDKTVDGYFCVNTAKWPQDMPRSAIGRKIKFTIKTRAGREGGKIYKRSLEVKLVEPEIESKSSRKSSR